MKLTGYFIAKDLSQEEDTITLSTPKVYFNRADALEAADGYLVLRIELKYPQNGSGEIRGDIKSA